MPAFSVSALAHPFRAFPTLTLIFCPRVRRRLCYCVALKVRSVSFFTRSTTSPHLLHSLTPPSRSRYDEGGRLLPSTTTTPPRLSLSSLPRLPIQIFPLFSSIPRPFYTSSSGSSPTHPPTSLRSVGAGPPRPVWFGSPAPGRQPQARCFSGESWTERIFFVRKNGLVGEEEEGGEGKGKERAGEGREDEGRTRRTFPSSISAISDPT